MPKEQRLCIGLTLLRYRAWSAGRGKAFTRQLGQVAQKAGGKPPEPFGETAWLRTAKRTTVRSKPYILQEAAQQCKKMAIKTGRLDVHLLEIKKMVA